MIAIAGTLVADLPAHPVQNLPERGSVAWVDHIGMHLGGVVSNSGIALHKMGVPVAAVGRVGKDVFGRVIAGELAKFANPVLLEEDLERSTTSAMVFIHADGERSFLASLGAGVRFSEADIPFEKLQAMGNRALLLGYINHLPGLHVDALKARLEQARNWGWLIALDVAWDPKGIWESTHQLLPLADVFCPNEREAEALTGCAEPEAAAKRLLEAGVRQAVAIKLGPDGCYLLTKKGSSLRLPGHAVKAVDSTGAGDAFIAGMLAGWYKGFPWEDCARIGNAAGALAVTGLGAAEGMRDWEDVLAFAAVR